MIFMIAIMFIFSFRTSVIFFSYIIIIFFAYASTSISPGTSIVVSTSISTGTSIVVSTSISTGTSTAVSSTAKQNDKQKNDVNGNERRIPYGGILGISALMLMLAVLTGLVLGSVNISLEQLVAAVLGGGEPGVSQVLLYVRLPRTLAAVLAGAALACSGAIIQSVMNNPLAGPNLVGVNAGAGLAAALCTAFFPQVLWAMSTAAFLGALGACLLIYGIAKASGASRMTLVLAGIAISSVLSAGIDAVVTLVPDAVLGVSAFRIGSLDGVTLKQLFMPGIYIGAALVLSLGLGNEMDILGLGEETARSLGMNTGLYRFLLLMTAALLAGAAVSFCGLLGFVGLIVPHGVRFVTGNESRKLLPVCMLTGSTFVLLCDVLARVLFAPFQVPVGVVMSFFGGPFFLWLLIRRKGGRLEYD